MLRLSRLSIDATRTSAQPIDDIVQAGEALRAEIGELSPRSNEYALADDITVQPSNDKSCGFPLRSMAWRGI